VSAIFLKSAVRNFVLRGECMAQARKAIGAQRKFLAYCARQHNRIAVAYLRDAKEFAHV